MKPCPICGKEMLEMPQFEGLWLCPDGNVRLNDSPPFKFKCDGKEITDEGALLFLDEIHKQLSKN